MIVHFLEWITNFLENIKGRAFEAASIFPNWTKKKEQEQGRGDAGAGAASATFSMSWRVQRLRARVTAKTGASPPPCPYPDAQRPVPDFPAFPQKFLHH